MWKMILGQSVYKLAIIFMLYFAGDNLLNAHLDSVDMEHRSKQLSTESGFRSRYLLPSTSRDENHKWYTGWYTGSTDISLH